MCVRITPVKSFLNQATHSKFMIKNPNAPLDEAIRFL